MDLLFKRYASPFLFLDGMIQTGRFHEFVVEFAKTITEEREEQRNWEFFLHKVFEGSFHDFVEQQRIDRENQNMSVRQIETTVQNSINILNKFSPDERGGEPNGFV